MKELPSVELVCVEGREDKESLNRSLKALLYSAKHIKFRRVLFLAPVKPDIEGDYEFAEIKSMYDMETYSRFMIKEYFKHLKNDYSLTVQWDGFIVKPELWNDSFLDFDWIGAPWPPDWPNRVSRVGNGGFCLRSKKLLETVATLDFEASPSKIEDNFICLENYYHLQGLGFKFAPPSLAAEFSWENPVPEREFGNSFGFHGRHPFCYFKYYNLIN